VEGDIYTSLYDGATAVKIEKITLHNNIADVEIEAVYAPEPQNVLKWSDGVVLKKENGFWKIDDVIYKGNEMIRSSKTKKTLKEILTANTKR
jgi:ABC-type transporter MlaC component